MTEHENTWDKLLKIKTTGRDDSNADQYCYPYEPTPYPVLERLANTGLIRKKDVVLDYGCGKGRVEFFLSYQSKAKTIGVEYDERMYLNALENRRMSVSGTRTAFVWMRAEEYDVPAEVSRCYFFNPFSVEILGQVMERLLNSYRKNPREILLFFYYPSDEYIAYLEKMESLKYYEQIACDDLFLEKNPRERIAVFLLAE